MDGGITKAILYVDGFNLYRRCLESHPDTKWLDLVAFARNLLPEYRVVKVHYFTARIKPVASSDPRAPQRQQAYLRALATLSKVEVHLGHFRADVRWMVAHPQEIDPDTGKRRLVRVRKIEEKGSDVNLAVRMLVDAHAGRAGLYVALTNDSDQAETLRVIKSELGQATGLVLPMETAKGSKELMGTAPDFVGYVTRDLLLASQLPDKILDEHGTITRPPEWAEKSDGPQPSAWGPSNR
jgi:hypothetical protein